MSLSFSRTVLIIFGLLCISNVRGFFFRASSSSLGHKSTIFAMREGPLTQKDYRAVINGTAIKSEDVATLPRPGTSTPSSIKFHGPSVTYLAPDAGGSLSRNLWATDLTTGKTRALFQSGDLGREGKIFHPKKN